jgi:hypothetical protein
VSGDVGGDWRLGDSGATANSLNQSGGPLGRSVAVVPDGLTTMVGTSGPTGARALGGIPAGGLLGVASLGTEAGEGCSDASGAASSLLNQSGASRGITALPDPGMSHLPIPAPPEYSVGRPL